MTEWYTTGSAVGSVDERTDAPTLFAQTMGLVAATAGFFALGAYVAQDLDAGWSLALWIASLACLILVYTRWPPAHSTSGGMVKERITGAWWSWRVSILE